MSPLFGEDGGSLLPNRRRSDSDVDMDITPMIDVTFLLLIFFMVSSTMKAAPDIDVPAAKFGTAVPTEAATIITVRAPQTPDGDSEVFLGDVAGRPGTLGEGDESVRRYVEEGMQKNIRQVIVKADRAVPYRFVEDVLREVTAVEGVTFSIGVRDPKRK